MKLGKMLTGVGAVVFTSLLGTALLIRPAVAQSSRPYVVFVNGWQNCCSWGMNALQDRLINQMKAEPRYVPYSNFDNNGSSGNTSTDERFLRDGADFINNQLDKNRPLILIGHSFGGDSVLKLLPRINRRIQFVAVLDPVSTGGFRSSLSGVPSNVDYFFNRWQENEPFPIDFVRSGSLRCSGKTCDQEEQQFYTNTDGSIVRVKCGTLETCSRKNKRIGHQTLPTDDWIQRILGDRISGVLAASSSSTPPVANTAISSTDSTRGWSWNGTIASYVTVENGQNFLYVQPFDGRTFGSVISRQAVSSSDAFRGWSWNGTTASYVTFKSGGKSILYVRPFDGRSFGSVTEQQVFSDTDSIRGWSWDGTTASYVTVQNGRNVLYVRPFNSQTFTFGSVTSSQTISSTDSIRGWSWDGATASYVTVNENGGNTVLHATFRRSNVRFLSLTEAGVG